MRAFKVLLKDNNGYYTNGGSNIRSDWEVGTRKKIEGKLELCKNGFHFYRHLAFAADYAKAINYLETDNAIAEVEVHGDIIEDTYKACTSDIEIIRIIPAKEIAGKVDKHNNTGNMNAGDGNAGNYNSGNGNAGNFNAGSRNAGDGNAGNVNAGNFNAGNYNSGNGNAGGRNAGDWNAGNGNAGDRNTGDRNAGNYNSGNGNAGGRNAGDGNAGDRNAGDGNAGSKNAGNGNAGDRNAGSKNAGNGNAGNFNAGNGNAGNYNSGNGYLNYFCTKTRYFVFDVEVDEPPEINMLWFNLTGKTYKEAWAECPESVLEKIRAIPQFDAAKFFEITGIRIK